MSLFWRILLANAAILVAAVVVLAISPLTVSHPINVVEAFVLVIGLIVLFAVNWWLVSRVMRPLNELRRRVEQIESSDTPPSPWTCGVRESWPRSRPPSMRCSTGWNGSAPTRPGASSRRRRRNGPGSPANCTTRWGRASPRSCCI